MAPKWPLDASIMTPTFDQKVIRAIGSLDMIRHLSRHFGKPETPRSFSLPKV